MCRFAAYPWRSCPCTATNIGSQPHKRNVLPRNGQKCRGPRGAGSLGIPRRTPKYGMIRSHSDFEGTQDMAAAQPIADTPEAREVAALIARSRMAQAQIENYTQEQVD